MNTRAGYLAYGKKTVHTCKPFGSCLHTSHVEVSTGSYGELSVVGVYTVFLAYFGHGGEFLPEILYA